MSPILTRCTVVLSLLVLAGTLGGCSKCGFFWEQKPGACRDSAPR